MSQKQWKRIYAYCMCFPHSDLEGNVFDSIFIYSRYIFKSHMQGFIFKAFIRNERLTIAGKGYIHEGNQTNHRCHHKVPNSPHQHDTLWFSNVSWCVDRYCSFERDLGKCSCPRGESAARFTGQKMLVLKTAFIIWLMSNWLYCSSFLRWFRDKVHDNVDILSKLSLDQHNKRWIDLNK